MYFMLKYHDSIVETTPTIELWYQLLCAQDCDRRWKNVAICNIYKRKLVKQRSNTKIKKNDKRIQHGSAKSAYVHREKTWESFVNKFYIRDLTFSLIPNRVLFTFSLNPSRLQGIPFLFTPSPTFLFALAYYIFLVLLLTRLQPLFIEFYNTNSIRTMR